jgi:hypothetical protein
VTRDKLAIRPMTSSVNQVQVAEPHALMHQGFKSTGTTDSTPCLHGMESKALTNGVCVRVRACLWTRLTRFKTSLHASLSNLFLARPLSIPFFPSSDFSVQSVCLSQSVVFSSRFFQRPAGGDNRVVMRRQLKCVGLLLLLLAALSPVVVVATARRGKLAKHAHGTSVRSFMAALPFRSSLSLQTVSACAMYVAGT